jgi:hypothetical protein
MEQYVESLSQGHFVAYRYKHGFGTRLRAQYGAYGSTVSAIEKAMIPTLSSGFRILPDEARLSTANSGDVKEDSKMAGDA